MAHQDPFVQQHVPAPEKWPTLLYGQPEFRFDADLNTTSYLFNRAMQAGWMERILLRSPNLNLTYQEVQVRVDQLVLQMQTQWQLPSGSRVLLRGANSIGMAIAWLAVCKAGYVVVASMPLLRAKELNEIVQKGQVTHALCDSLLRTELDTVCALSGSMLKELICFTHDAQFDWAQATPTKTKDDLLPYLPSTDDIGLLAFTSGTTGVPKAACHSHRDILSACNAWPLHVLKATPDDIIIGSPPLAFTFGLGGLLLFPMHAGASVYFHDKGYSPEVMVDTIRQVGATISYTAPTFYRQMAAFALNKPMPTLRISVSAGEALPDATRTLWKSTTQLDMLDGIGATEMFHIFISSAGSEIRPGAIGKIVPGYSAKVVDEQGNRVPVGTVGKLAVVGPTGCKYLSDDRQANYVKNGWNFPGDAFYEDADGYFFYQSRTDDMIISSGYNIGGPEVESCLLNHPSVTECGVIGKPDLERGMIVKAFVVLKDQSAQTDDTKKQLQDWVKQQLAPYKYPREIQFLNALPRTETGKLQRFKLRELENSNTHAVKP